jgi:hypothetical protein
MTLHLFAGPGGMEAGDGNESVGVEFDDGTVATRRAAGLGMVGPGRPAADRQRLPDTTRRRAVPGGASWMS